MHQPHDAYIHTRMHTRGGEVPVTHIPAFLVTAICFMFRRSACFMGRFIWVLWLLVVVYPGHVGAVNMRLCRNY